MASTGLAVGASRRKRQAGVVLEHGAAALAGRAGHVRHELRVGILGAIPAVATDFDESGSCAVTMTRADGARYAYASGTSFAVPEVAGRPPSCGR